MEAQQEWHFSTADQFWQELDELIAVPPDSSLEELDYCLRNYIAFASSFMDQFLAEPGALDHALLALLSSPLFTDHADRMTDNIVSSIVHPDASSATLFISLMLVLHLGEGANPLTTAGVWANPQKPGAGVTVGSSKVFRQMRKRWSEVVPVLMKWVWDAGVVEDRHTGEPSEAGKRMDQQVGMPVEGWEERVGTAATAVLYEMCRVQKLTLDELSDFTFHFISHLFSLIERTRDAEDETFNYSLIKLIIALNEQFMVCTVPAAPKGSGKLPPPILPTVVGKTKRERGPNTVLEVLKEKEHESKTFGENIIFILNRADGTPDSLCVSLLILKILYLLFTTSGTQEYFYTNDLCVLVDVFIRELYNLGEESEGLKHTYLRVLHPLLTNTQLRHYPYKRQELRRVLECLIAPSYYRDCDPTTRRLVERNLRGSWCQGLRSAEAVAAGRSLGSDSATGSTLSADAVARADDEATRKHKRKHSHRKSRRQTSLDETVSSRTGVMIADGRTVLQPLAERAVAGQAPEAVRSSYAAYTFSPEPHSEAILGDPAADYDPTSSVPSISAGHDLLEPVAQRLRASPPHSSTNPATSGSLARPLVHHRPRSTSLSAASYRSSTHGMGLSESPPAPLPPSPAMSAASLSASVGDLPSACATPRRRRPPPPPTEGGSRPRTPAPQTVLPQTTGGSDGSGPPSPHTMTTSTGRRRPPPPPTQAGRASPRVYGSFEEETRRRLEAAAIS
ncbi:hypothetical protein Rt10032_c10g4293 [Rhodotorula toruloides]|uniref:SPIN90/Ldb17 leucine-rich domain-containing protein n=1 Tax=Rhodotorula toruloides TaxID=5286 RepID=A0A511KK94_RHOTO|nr:hypothetical protein Rt10032_c10g4293 [Rhodotorula toruloides]